MSQVKTALLQLNTNNVGRSTIRSKKIAAIIGLQETAQGTNPVEQAHKIDFPGQSIFRNILSLSRCKHSGYQVVANTPVTKHNLQAVRNKVQQGRCELPKPYLLRTLVRIQRRSGHQ